MPNVASQEQTKHSIFEGGGAGQIKKKKKNNLLREAFVDGNKSPVVHNVAK